MLSEYITIVVVDPDTTLLSELRRYAVQEGHTLLHAETGARGLDLLSTIGDVGLIMASIEMPGMKATDFLAKARVVHPRSVRVLMGKSDIPEQEVLGAIEAGVACRYLDKPASANAFSHALDSLCRIAGSDGPRPCDV